MRAMNTSFSLAVLAIACMAVGCAHHQMSKRTVIQTGSGAFESAGYKAADYKKPEVSLYSTPTNSTWCVFYDPVFNHGSAIRILIDDKTGAATFAPLQPAFTYTGSYSNARSINKEVYP